MGKVFRLLPLLFLLAGCHSNRLKVDLSAVQIDMTVKRLDHDLFALSMEQGSPQIQRLNAQYGPFFTLYNREVIGLGEPSDSLYGTYLNTFLTDTVRLASKRISDSLFSNFAPIEAKLKEAFRHYKYYFPSKHIPQIVTMISGFNQAVVVTPEAIGISLDDYLGPECPFYAQLAIPRYKRATMYPEKIPADALYGWAMTEFEQDESKSDLLSNMIYQGKLHYFLDALFPDEADSVKIGFSESQLDWCKNHQGSMWTYLVEQKMLFNTDRMNIVRFINPAPFTTCFTAESPGRTGIWIGWQIVRHYMQNHPEVSLSALMGDNDAQKILNESGYSPEE